MASLPSDGVIRSLSKMALSAMLESRHQMSHAVHAKVSLAIVHDLKIVLLDEPLSNLDAELRVAMCKGDGRLLRQIGCTMISVTRNQIEANGAGQRHRGAACRAHRADRRA